MARILMIATAALALSAPASAFAEVMPTAPEAEAASDAVAMIDAETLIAAGTQWKELYEAGEWDKLRALYTEDAILMTAGQPKLEGVDNIITFLQRLSNMGASVSFQFEPEEAIAEGDFGFVTAKYLMTIAFPGRDPVPVAGRSFLIYKRVDGGWLLWRDMDNLAPGVTPDSFAP